MLSQAFFLCLLAMAYAETPQFHVRSGICPTVSSSDNFNPSDLYDYDWRMFVHSDSNQNVFGCVTVKYTEESSSVFRSHRSGKMTNGTTREFWSRLTKINDDGSYNRYLFQYKDGGEWKNTGMKTAFYFPQGDTRNFMVYGCMPRGNNEYSDVVLMMSKDTTMSPSKINQFKDYLTSKSAGQDQYYDIANNNCS